MRKPNPNLGHTIDGDETKRDCLRVKLVKLGILLDLTDDAKTTQLITFNRAHSVYRRETGLSSYRFTPVAAYAEHMAKVDALCVAAEVKYHQKKLQELLK